MIFMPILQEKKQAYIQNYFEHDLIVNVTVIRCVFSFKIKIIFDSVNIALLFQLDVLFILLLLHF